MGKKKGRKQESQDDKSSKQTQKSQQPGTSLQPEQQQQKGPQPQQSNSQQQQPQGPQQQQPRRPQQQQPRCPQQQQPRGPQQQQPRGPQQQQPSDPPQLQQWGPPQQQQVGPQQHQQWGPPQQQQVDPQQYQPKGPQQQQPGGPQQQQPRSPQQQQPSGPPQQQPRDPKQQEPRGPQQQQQVDPQQYQPKGPQQRQPRGPQQQQPRGPKQQEPRGPQQQQPGGPQQQQPRGPKQQEPRGPQQQQPGGTQQQQQSGPAPPQAPSGLSTQITGFERKNINRPGTKGRKIRIEVNHLELNLGSLKVAYHYDVHIVPDTPKKFLRPVIEQFRATHFPKRYPAFDGRKNIYASMPLSGNFGDIIADQVTIKDEGDREKTFKVEIKFANEVDLTPLRDLLSSQVTPQEALQCVDIVLRSAPVKACVQVGRSFFNRPESIIDLGEGMEMYYGFYQSAIRGWKPFLNVDVAHKAFPKAIPVIDALVDLFSNPRERFTRESLQRELTDFQLNKLRNYIKTLRISYEIPNSPGSQRQYRVNGIGAPPSKEQFVHNGANMTIRDYFQKVKGYYLRYPFLPTLWVGSTQRKDKILLPLELCTLLQNQAVNRKMTEMQTSKMIREAATSTKIRKDKITRSLNMANYNNSPVVKEFGFSVASQFQQLDARVLNPPQLEYKGKMSVTPSKGVWRNEKFITGVTINRWTIVNATRYPFRDDVYEMSKQLTSAASSCGMTFNAGPDEPFKSIGGRQTLRDAEALFTNLKPSNYDVIFVVVPDSGDQYSYVKKAAEITAGCLTQCIKSSTMGRRMNRQTAVNLLLKVNSKLNGLNHCLLSQCKPAILKRPVMIMGADVTHPSPDATGIPSVAAVTASHDPTAFKYNICWRLQPPKVEIIEDLTEIVKEQLMYFYKINKGQKPQAIVFFRDGVSEGQFEQVRRIEIQAIRKACKALQGDGYEPKITFLVVQKRHHTRMFPTNDRDSEDRNCNVPAGTCVDSVIVHPFLQDFYLVSHASIQGVAKPTKYCTLWDDNNMSNDDVEELAYYLCHLFTRCNRSVSYPAPTYYAHLAAARAKVYIEKEPLNMNSLQDEFRRFTIQTCIRQGFPMFFV